MTLVRDAKSKTVSKVMGWGDGKTLLEPKAPKYILSGSRTEKIPAAIPGATPWSIPSWSTFQVLAKRSLLKGKD
jgi:hypothetical protein